MNINPLRATFAENYLKVSNKTAAKTDKGKNPLPPGDSVDLSPLASFRQKIDEAQDLTRQDRIKEIGKEIDDGSYVTEEKLFQAIDSAIDSALNGL